jgi:type IX secretion system PorP/SprF family membrane protein
MTKKLAVLALCFLAFFQMKAQDIQFSQFYAAPLYLNPAFAGSTELARAGVNYRNQWPSIPANFVTYSAYFDYFFDDYNSGLGILMVSDQAGTAGIRSNAVAVQYAYQLRLTEKLSLRAGLEGGVVFRDLNFNNLIFGDQLDYTGVVSATSLEQFNSDYRLTYFDLSAGTMLYSQNFWLGFAAHHLAEPNLSALNLNDPLPRKYSFHGGYKILLPTRRDLSYGAGYREVSLTPAFQYKAQGPFSQMDLGMYFNYEPLVTGIWYRGVPTNSVEGIANHESIIFLLGFSANNFNIGYSFDYTLSALSITTGGAHEISISYAFFLGDPRKPPKNIRQIPCPRF